MGVGDTRICKTRAKPGKPAEITAAEQGPGTGIRMHCPLWPKKWIAAMRGGERVNQKARRDFPPGLSSTVSSCAFLHESCN
jgi:hypothetical protein